MGVDMSGTVYGVWDGDELIAVGTGKQLAASGLDTHSDTKNGRYVRMLTPSGGRRYPNKWRDIAAATLRDLHELDYEEIAELLHVTVGMAQAAVSRTRCGRYGTDDE